MSKLFEPIKIRDLEIRNRIFIPAMCQYSCENQDGVVHDWHMVHLGARATGGAGMIIAEATGVTPEGRISPWCPGIWNLDQVAAWGRVNAFIHSQGAKSALQLAHSGRKGSTYRDWSGRGEVPIEKGGWQTVSSTSKAFDGMEAPRELTTAEVKELVQDFLRAAKHALLAGFDAVEIHAAHGYLIHQFLSPITNHRSDEYGGSLENRARFLLEIVEGVRTEIGELMPIFVRFSATDYREDGWDLEQTTQVAKWCAELGADLFDISSGGLITGVNIPSGPGYQVPLAEKIAQGVSQPVAAVGQITEPAQAEKILQDGDVDVVLIGRASLRDPYWALRAAHELNVELDYWPKHYNRGKFPKTN
jgi:2,4-dienoyl-CoA reductase-like NADH-dependent reductase (Old Yellow Enzyme family)